MGGSATALPGKMSVPQPAQPPEESAGSWVSPMFIAKLMLVLIGLNFVMTYIFAKQTIPGYFSEPPTEEEMPLLVYMGKVCGQNMSPALFMTVISVVSGTVTKQYILAVTIFQIFGVFEIMRVMTWKEAIKVDVAKVFPYMPVSAVVAYLSYDTWKAMPADPLDASATAAGPIVSAMCLTKIMLVFWVLNFLMSYVFAAQTLPTYFKEPPTGKAMLIGVYMCKICGQWQLYLVLFSLVSVVSGTVTKQYMLMLVLHNVFVTFDILRLASWKETLSLDVAKFIPYVPFTLAFAYLSYTCWAAM
jgi:hypothetical protein